MPTYYAAVHLAIRRH